MTRARASRRSMRSSRSGPETPSARPRTTNSPPGRLTTCASRCRPSMGSSSRSNCPTVLSSSGSSRWADGALVGELILDESGPIHVVDFAIARPARGRGIGTAVLLDLRSIATQRRAALTLEVEPQSAARTLYERLGFVEVVASDVHVAMSWSSESGTKSSNRTDS